QSQYTDGEGNPFPFALPIGQGLGIGIINVHIDAVLRSIQTDYNLNILSRPHLVTLDNQEASIEVGDQIPYKVLSQYGITSYEFKSATVKLLIKPHINNDRTITIEIKPNADFQNGQTPDGIPIIATRKASTKVKVGNGKTIIIGGLMRDSDVQTISKVPILGSIPILGALFRSKINKKEKTELVIFITPRIMSDKLAESELVPEKHLSDDAVKKLNKLQGTKN
ncbi:MAG: type II and III secretion system protein, partial [Candidatus Marinimicrobia bacterium]|nr:type II and III secretion system protein [Candidatus Neomarinimicrobiota bacterium]